MLEDSSDFTRRVKGGNRIKYVGNAKRDPEKKEVANNDMPETRLVPLGFEPHLQRTSNSSWATMRYAIEVRSGEKNLNVAHFPLLWSVYRAMAPWRTRLRALLLNSNPFVVQARFVGDTVEDMERGGEVSRGVEGWFAIWTVEVQMQFPTADL